MMVRTTILSIIVVLQTGVATAAPITSTDFQAGAVTIDFNSVSGFIDGSEFGQGLHLRSGPGVEPALNVTPADVVQIGTEFPGAMSSPPNKIVGAHVDQYGAYQGCGFCAIIVEFDTPRQQVGFWVTDPDAGQYADFFGPNGFIATIPVTAGSSATAWFMGYEHLDGISRVEIHSATWVGLGVDDLTFSAAVPEPSSVLLVGFGLSAMSARCKWSRTRRVAPI